MVLYQIDHPGFLLKCIIHKCYFHPHEEATFLFNEEFMGEQNVVAKEVRAKKDLFEISNVYLYPGSYNFSSSLCDEEKLEQLINNGPLNFLNTNGVILSEMSEIYFAEDMTRTFQILCQKDLIKYNILEGTGKFEHYCKHNTPVFKYLAKLCEKNHGLIKNIYSFVEEKGIHPYSPDAKWIYFDYISCFKSLDIRYKQSILELFNLFENVSMTNIDLFCGDSSWLIRNRYNLFLNEANSATTLLIDYCCERKQYIWKPHPKSDFNLYCENVKLPKINAYIPIELLGIIDGVSIDTVTIGKSSNSVASLKKITREVKVLGEGYQKIFSNFHQLYFSIKAIRSIFPQQRSILGVGFSDMELAAMNNMNVIRECGFMEVKNLNKTENNNKAIVLVNMSSGVCNDYMDILKSNSVSCCFLIYNNLADISSIYEEIHDNLVYSLIHKHAFRVNGIYANQDDEVLFMFSKDKGTKERFVEYKDLTHLSYSGLDMEISAPKGLERMVIDMGLKCGEINK